MLDLQILENLRFFNQISIELNIFFLIFLYNILIKLLFFFIIKYFSYNIINYSVWEFNETLFFLCSTFIKLYHISYA